MNSVPHPFAKVPSRSLRRSQVLVVMVVASLSVLVSGFYLWSILLAAHSDPSLTIPPLWAYGAWAAGTIISAALLWWHQQHPILVFTGVFALHLMGAVLIGDGGLGGVALPLWFSIYALASFARPLVAGFLAATAWAIATTLQLVLTLSGGLTLSAPEIVVVAFGQGFFFLACYMIGVGMRAERQRAHDATERTRLVAERTRAESANAVSRERNRMARELHDLAAHQIMDVLLTTRAALLSDPNPVLEELEQKTGEALGSIRSVVGALRDDDTDTALNEPEPLEDAVNRIINRVSRERGLHVEHRIVIGEEPSSAATATLVSILTEALINAATHAPGQPVTVTLNCDSGGIYLEVQNPLLLGSTSASKPTGSGYGLIGGAERAQILSGQLKTGKTENDHWVLRLKLPNQQLEAPQ